MEKNRFFEITQMLVYFAAYNYLYTTSMASFKWGNYLFCFLPVFFFSGPNYCFYFFARQFLLYRFFYNKYAAALTVLLAYAFIAFFSFLFVSQILPDDGSVADEALSRASLYSPLFILPFLVLECVFEKLRKCKL